jgi:hypothetical protein
MTVCTADYAAKLEALPSSRRRVAWLHVAFGHCLKPCQAVVRGRTERLWSSCTVAVPSKPIEPSASTQEAASCRRRSTTRLRQARCVDAWPWWGPESSHAAAGSAAKVPQPKTAAGRDTTARLGAQSDPSKAWSSSTGTGGLRNGRVARAGKSGDG